MTGFAGPSITPLALALITMVSLRVRAEVMLFGVSRLDVGCRTDVVHVRLSVIVERLGLLHAASSPELIGAFARFQLPLIKIKVFCGTHRLFSHQHT